MRRKRIFTTFAVSAVFFATALVANAEVYIKQTRHTDPLTVMGQTQPAKDETVVTWLGKDRARIDMNEETSTIVIPSKKIMYMLNHEDLTYTEMPLSGQDMFAGMPQGEQSEEAKEALEMAKSFAKGFMQSMEAKVTETAETKKIRNWNCRKYLIEMSMPIGKSKSEAWATEGIKIDPQLYWVASNAGIASQQGFEKIIEEMKKVKGIIVYQETKAEAMGATVRTVEEVVEVSEKPAPAGSFDVPKGYKKTSAFGAGD